MCPLASGSKGNSIYLEHNGRSILIDVGISFKALKERCPVPLDKIEGILVTHDHTDHTRGIARTSKQLGVPVFANRDTAAGIMKTMTVPSKFKIFCTGEEFDLAEFTILPFGVQHDTLDPVGFVIWAGNTKIGICTDLGFASTLTRSYLQHCNILYLESNHEESMVHMSNRSSYYKQRVLGKQGHLSNEDSSKLLKEINNPKLKHVCLAHLSSECNDPALALKKASKSIGYDTTISIAYQDRPSVPMCWEE